MFVLHTSTIVFEYLCKRITSSYHEFPLTFSNTVVRGWKSRGFFFNIRGQNGQSYLENRAKMADHFYGIMARARVVMVHNPAHNPALSKFVGPVGQSDIFSTKNVRVSDPMSDDKNIHLVDKKNETRVTIKDNNYVLCHLAGFVGTGSTLNFKWSTFIL